VVDAFDETTALVELSEDNGVTYAIVPCPRDALLVEFRLVDEGRALSRAPDRSTAA
jgi:hypothetical protein